MEEARILLAAEDFSDEQFANYHTFSDYENRIILKLVAHGPVLLRGGRGIGKSALLKEAYYRINRGTNSQNAMGIYFSCRSLPLLRSKGLEYEKSLCEFMIYNINKFIEGRFVERFNFSPEPDVGEVQKALIEFANWANKRIVLYFDDVAHIGRETSVKEFFDVFRTLSSSLVSCKAAIYPGVTEFGDRFDLLNDAIVIDIARSEQTPSFGDFFTEIMRMRYTQHTKEKSTFSRMLRIKDVAKFMGRAVMGNVRAFIFACNYLFDEKHGETVTITDIDKTLKFLATDYYWPLFEELEPKLGPYESLINPAREIGEIIYKTVSDNVLKQDHGPSCLIHRDHVERLKKVFEILEYIGFISKRETSRALKSGGRGPRYALNLCNLLENLSPNRLTSDLFHKWLTPEKVYSEIFKNGDVAKELIKINMPEVSQSKDLGILSKPIEILEKSNAYPYGLTQYRISILKNAGIETVGDLANTSQDKLLMLSDIGSKWSERIENVCAQAIWM